MAALQTGYRTDTAICRIHLFFGFMSLRCPFGLELTHAFNKTVREYETLSQGCVSTIRRLDEPMAKPHRGNNALCSPYRPIKPSLLGTCSSTTKKQPWRPRVPGRSVRVLQRLRACNRKPPPADSRGTVQRPKRFTGARRREKRAHTSNAEKAGTWPTRGV